MKKVYGKLWVDSRGKKRIDFGEVWGEMKKKDANCRAVLTGNGIVVVDVDRKDAIPKWLKGLKPTVETARGYHYYFNVGDSSKYGNRVGVVEGVDIRSDGGLVFDKYWGDDDRVWYKRVGDVIGTGLPKKLKKLMEVDGKKSGKKRVLGVSEREVRDMMKYVDGYDNYEDWFKVGMALKNWDSELGFDIWNEWSMKSDKYDSKSSMQRKWQSFSNDGDLSIGTIQYMARENGYDPMGNDFEPVDGVISVGKLYTDDLKDEWWLDDPTIDRAAIVAYMKNTGYDTKGRKFTWISSSGRSRDFVESEMDHFFKHYRVRGFDVDEWVKERGEFKNTAEYWKYIRSSIIGWIKFHNQYKLMRVMSDPFAENGVRFEDEVMYIVTNDIMAKKPARVVDTSVVNDYKEHFPALDEMLDMMLAVRFGADRKKAYLWLKATSDWGKSFLFVGVLGKLGITTMIKEKELKSALGGSPSGLNPEEFYTAWVTVFEEFKGAVSELKDITHSMIISPKGRMRAEVDLYTKIFLSAENVNSLVGTNGMEKQFDNRFMNMDLEGTLVGRKLFDRDPHHYLNALTWYVYNYLHNGMKMYIELGKHEAAIRATEVFEPFRKKYKMKSVDLMESVADIRVDYYNDVKMKMKKFGKDNDQLHELYHLTRGGKLYIRKLELAKDHFLHTMFGHSDIAKLNHKTAYELMDIDKDNRTSITINSVKFNAYKVRV